jgi:CheY-like chemotaxis protein
MHIELATEVPPLWADKGQLETVLVNLATNARDAMPKGGLLRISTENVVLTEEEARRIEGGRAGEHVLLCVADGGTGMTSEVKSRMFEPFFTTKPAGKGTGLGLAMVFGLVAQSGGFIAVESAPELGTTFRLYFPRARIESKPPRRAEQPLRQGTETLLLAEDERAVREVVTSMLELAGYAVLTADSLASARRVWAEHGERVALLLTDVVMPGGSGHELAQLLRAERPDLPVLFITGYDPSARGEASDAPTLRKPFTRDQLLRSVRRKLDGQRRPRA